MYKLFSEILGKDNVFENEPMKNHTTFRIGGPADIFIKCKSAEDAKLVLGECQKNNLPYFVIGNGSNLLVSDKGIRGVVLQIEDEFSNAFFDVKNGLVTVQAGIKLSKLSALALKNSLSGLEAISGIPGTVGGALYMNAGAYGSEISELVESVTYLDQDSKLNTISGKECGFGYRKSIFSSSKMFILSSVLKLKPDNADNIKTKMAEYKKRRVEKQPVDKMSAGSTFKRPEGNFAGTLIEKSGLKGTMAGGAKVSEKHAGFIINTGNASAEDVIELIKLVQEKVYENSGIKLEPEVRFVGEF